MSYNVPYDPSITKQKGKEGGVEGAIAGVITAVGVVAVKSVLGENVPEDVVTLIAIGAGAAASAIVVGVSRLFRNWWKHH